MLTAESTESSMMAGKTVLILGDEHDGHVGHMYHRLKHLSVDVEIICSRWFPQWMGLSFDPLTAIWRVDLPSGRTLWSTEIRSVYWRSYDGVGEVGLADVKQNFIAQNDARSLFESFLIHLPVDWVNGWTAFQLHQTKPVQLARVAQLGVRIPATTFSNHADIVRRFASENQECIFKPVQGGDATRKLYADDLTDEKLSSLRLAPITLQEAIPETNIRVFVAGSEVMACEVRTSFADYRDDPNAELLPHRLPAAVAESCRRIARSLALRWTGIDFRLTSDKQYVFLEANPSPMFLGFESQTQLPLTELLLSLLVTPQLQGRRRSEPNA